MNNNWTGSSGNKPQNVKIQNFLEALRNSQTNLSNRDANEFAGTRNPFSEIQSKKEVERKRVEQFQQTRNQEWNKVFSSKEKQTENRIEEIRQQLQNLAKQVKRLDTNIIKAVQNPIVKADAYDESYFEHIRKTIHLFSLKVNSANSWLEMYNSRSKKQGHYWGMASSHGTSFTLNNERAVATSVG